MWGFNGQLKRSFWSYTRFRIWIIILGILIATTLLFGVAKYTEDNSLFILSPNAFLTLHILLEFMSIMMAFCIFAITYYTSEETKSLSMIIIACVFLATAPLDTMHTFSYKGMPVFIINPSANTATLFWIISRFIMSVGLFFASLFPQDREIKGKQIAYVAITIGMVGLIIGLILYKPGLFPVMYIEGKGLTPLKIGLEFLITGILLTTALVYYRKYNINHEDREYFLLAIGFFISGLGELAFTLYSDVYDSYNLLGHLYKFLARYLLFRSLFVINIRKPYRNLWEAEKKLNNYVDDLERSVTQRTKEIRKANEKLVKNLKDAQHIQRALMTTEFPKIPGMEFAAKYLPCEQVGGDFYSVFRLDEQNIGILIGDVAGHGVSAAMVNVFINQNMRFRVDYNERRYRILTPRGVLMNLYHVYNTMSFPEEMYVVLFYGIYNIATGKLTYSSAGMNTYPLILSAQGEVSYIKLDGFPICKFGKYFKPDYETKTLSLSPGDTMIFYSDGLGEIDRKRPNVLSTEHIMEYLRGMKGYSAQEVCQGLSDAYHTLLGDNEMLDDVTILVIKTP
ncbi:MAG: MASE3 domain-containing protein [Caldicoprobacterales bacterium]|jgi:sigma-B regulation protein RsbU (phosphoserine phosphatase)|nr:SpoIIE family protein phosphatase [Clostridiales bacterium]